MKLGQQGEIHEDGAAGVQTKRLFYGDKAMEDRGILDVFVSVLVFLFYMLVCDWNFIYCYCMLIKTSFLK